MQHSKSLLDDYIDIEKIIKKIQEIDKLKLILLTEPQRFLFDLVPKPVVSEGEMEAKNVRAKQELSDNYEKILKRPDELEKRLLGMLDEKDLQSLNVSLLKKTQVIFS